MAEEFTAKFRVDISDLKKNITEANKQIKLANATFKKETAGMDDWTKDADGLTAKLKQLDSVLNSQKAILSSYREQLERQEQGYEQNGKRANELKEKLRQLASQGVDKASDEYKEYESELVKALKEQEKNGKAADDLKIKLLNQEAAVSKTEKEIRDYSNQLDHAGDEVRDLSKAEQQANSMSGKLGDGFTTLKGIAANLASQGIRKLGQELKGLVTDGAAYADEILTMSKTTSLSTATLQKFNYMAGLVDVDVNTVAGSLKKLTKNMSSAEKGSGSAYDAFQELGVSFQNADGSLRDNEETFYDVLEALGKVENETERDALAMKLFGKNATELNPMIEAGADALQAWGKEAEEAGYIMDEDMLKGLGELQDSFDRFKNRITAVKNEVAAGLAPAVNEGTQELEQMVSTVDWKKFGRELGAAFKSLINAMTWIIKNWKTVATGLGAIVAAMAVSKINAAATAVKGFATTLKSLWGIIAANPVTAFVGAIVAAGAALIIWQKSLYDAERAADKGWQMTDRLTEAVSEQVAVIDEMVAKSKELEEAREANLNSGLAEISHVEELKAELDKLADANGVVAKSDQARAQFILNELNNALGTEYTMTGNVIDQYSDLSAAIDDVIAKKKAEVILAAQEDAYREAIQNRAIAEQNLIDAATKRDVIERKIAENTAHYNELMSATGPQLAANAKEAGKLVEQNLKLRGELDKLNASYQEAADEVNKYTYNVTAYEDNMAKSLQGNYKDIKYASYETAKAMGQDMDDYAAKVQKDANAAARDFSLLQGKIRSAAKNIPQGVADGINEGAGVAYSAMSAFGNNLLKKFKQTMEIKSPSRKMIRTAKEIDEGAAVGVDKNQGVALAAMRALGINMTDAFDDSLELSTADRLKNAFSSLRGATAGLNAGNARNGALNALNGIQTQTAGSTGGGTVINNDYTQIINAPKQPSRYELYQQTKNLFSLATGRA